MYSNDRLLILDADGTTVDAFRAIAAAFAHHGMDIGDLERFQKRRHLFKYLGGLKEFPGNLRRQIGRRKRALLIGTLTEIYRHQIGLYDGIRELIERATEGPRVRVGIVTRNITREPIETLRQLFARNGVDHDAFDFLEHLPLDRAKTEHFRVIREAYSVNPARAYACGDERQDFEAATQTGMHPFMVSYGFEDYDRLTGPIGVPPELVSRDPRELRDRVLHALELDRRRPYSSAIGTSLPAARRAAVFASM
ncbi:MAG: HAD hydrolase-like protein [Gammaproteobacteria bacterium]|jgi:phosphoglycolate phosphatase|nr:HAD hydrolase-like protein [Gammaproteobacteria bacterium]